MQKRLYPLAPRGRGQGEGPILPKITLYILLITISCQVFSINSAVAKKVKVYTDKDQYLYEQHALRDTEIEKYERNLLPQSGYMTTEEYENASKDVTNDQKVIQPYQPPNDIKMKYVPQPTYKLSHYNDPPGSPELHLPLQFKYNRQVNGNSITSPNKDFLVYPVIYYYVVNQCVSSDLFVIPLEKSLPDVERIKMANVIKRIPTPILSTDKSVDEKYTFRTLTPIDFSPDGTKLAVKEKIGNTNDGIWKTNLWVYDFSTNKATELPQVREAIKYYWMKQKNILLDDKRWDIYPLGFDANDPTRVVVSAYGYTGKTPVFLGNWSIDYNGQRSELLSLSSPDAKITVSGLKLVQDGVVNPTQIYNNEKQQDKLIKKKRKTAKKEVKKIKKEKKKALKHKLKEMKKEEKAGLKHYNKQMNSHGITGIE